MTLGGQAVARQVVFRGTTRYWLSPLCFIFGVGFTAIAWDHFDTATGWRDVLKVGCAVAGLIVVWMGVMTWFGGVRAGSRGVRITNIWFRYYIPWTDLLDITVHEVSDEGVGAWSLQFHRAEGKPITASYPRGHSGPGEGTRLDRARIALLALRDDVLYGGGGSASVPLAKAQVVSLTRTRMQPTVVEVAVVIGAPDGRYVHRRMTCSGTDLRRGLHYLFAPNPETLRRGGRPSAPREVRDEYFDSPDQALEAAEGKDTPADPEKWIDASQFAEFVYENLAEELRPEAERMGLPGTVIAGIAAVSIFVGLMWVTWVGLEQVGTDADAEWDILGGVFFLAMVPAAAVFACIEWVLSRRNLRRARNR